MINVLYRRFCSTCKESWYESNLLMFWRIYDRFMILFGRKKFRMTKKNFCVYLVCLGSFLVTDRFLVNAEMVYISPGIHVYIHILWIINVNFRLRFGFVNSIYTQAFVLFGGHIFNHKWALISMGKKSNA